MTDEYRGFSQFSGNDLARLFASGRIGRDVAVGRTISLEDIKFIIRYTGGSPANFTIPRVAAGYDWIPGSAMICNNYGAGIVTMVAGSGVTLNSKDGLVSAGQHGWFGAYYWGDDEWTAFGALTT